MNPEMLTALTAAKGVPFEGRGATLRELAEQAGWFKPGKGKANGKVRWNLPSGDRSAKAAEWSMAEAAMACQGLDQRYFYALRYQYALDDSVYYPLRRYLFAYAVRQKKRQHWPTLIETDDGEKRYLMTLVEMQLIEIRVPWRFVRNDSKQPGINRSIMHVSKNTWARRLEPIYETLGGEYRRWLSVGVAHMRRWLA